MTPFGNRDFERAPTGEGADAHGREHDDAFAQLLEEPSPGLPVARNTRRVVVRLNGGEDVEVGRAEGREPAVRMARDMVSTIEDAETAGEWPLVHDRFLRPGAIVSIDVQRADW